jgi:hypothetical protein
MRNDVLIIGDLRESKIDNQNEVSACVDGERVFFRSPLHYDIACCIEPFLGIVLLEAMIRNADISIESSIPLSKKLYEKLPEIQSIYAFWNSGLCKVSIKACVEPLKNDYERVTSFYSGGVDGSHTLYRNISEITHLIMLSNFEVTGNTSESWQFGIDEKTAFARKIGKQLIAIETNAKQWADKRKIDWGFAQGLILASMGSLLKSKRSLIASSHTYNELFAWGSHPLTDPMWSTESTEIIHDGAGFRRGDKIRDLINNQEILDNLRVCWRSNHKNCGECAKCIRTMTALYLMGASSRALPDFDIKKTKLNSFKTYDKSGATFLEDAIILAKNAKNKKIYNTLCRYFRKYQMRQIIIIFDRYILGNIFRRLYRKLFTPVDSTIRVKLYGPQPWDL